MIPIIFCKRRAAAGALAFVLLATPSALLAEDPPFYYVVTDITGWTAEQRAAIPFFRRAILAPPPAALPLYAKAHNRSQVTVGDTGNSTQPVAVYSADGDRRTLNYIGQHYWSYTIWDGQDLHFYNGYVRHSHLYDVNALGVAVGESTLPTSSDSALDWTSAVVMVDPAAPGQFMQLDLGYERGAGLGVNDDGAITGWVSNIGTQRTGFRRLPDGAIELLTGLGSSTQGVSINNAGMIAGESLRTTDNRMHAIAVLAGSTTAIDLGLPSTGPSDAGSAYDLNEEGVICGAVWDQHESFEHYGAVWLPDGAGQWVAWELNEMLTENNHKLENARAINNLGMIYATGRPDGSDTFGSGAYILTPEGVSWDMEAEGWVLH